MKKYKRINYHYRPAGYWSDSGVLAAHYENVLEDWVKEQEGREEKPPTGKSEEAGGGKHAI